MNARLHYLVGVALTLVCSMPMSANAQSNPPFTAQSPNAQSTWQSPPDPIPELLDAQWFPAVKVSPNRQWLVRLERPTLPAIAELAQPRVQVAGLQLDRFTRTPALNYTLRGIEIQNLVTGEIQTIALPENAQIDHLHWSPDGDHLAFTLTKPNGLELWVLDLPAAEARQLTPPVLNATYGEPCKWLSAEAGLLCKVVPDNQPDPPAAPVVANGPRIEQNLGREAPSRTFTNLLQNPHDEALFEYYLTSALELVSLNGDRKRITGPQLIQSATASPDGQWILLTTIERPFSYQVPAQQFPKRVSVLNLDGKEVFRVADLPLADDVPVTFDSRRTGRRVVHWRGDRPAMLYWVEALDGGDASRSVEKRDAVYLLDAPFTNEPELLWQTDLRYYQMYWGHDNLALGMEYWYDSRRVRTWQIDPANPTAEPILLEDRDFQDAYSDPGEPMTAPGVYGHHTLVLAPDGNSLYFKGRGASPEGIYPFLDRWNLETRDRTRLWQSADPYYEQVVVLFDNAAEQIMTARQSQSEPPNYWQVDLASGQRTALTDFTDPMPWYADANWEVVRYQRADGVELSATLYLPPGYNPATDGPLPTLLWAYPQEYKSRDAAAQVTTAENRFSRPYGYSPLLLLTQGYALMMGPTMPIIGEGNAEPNDTYLEQLSSSAEAAVNYLVERGISDPDQIAIAGHSYGAFTVANLLAHTNLFRAGIANSGAYNRTLTPFGFQGEQRTFWDAPETYISMSPFTHAGKINEPLLLIHGAADDNPGTYPIQSERLYGAMQGLGGTVRWVELPHEGHGYQSREAIGHVMWEMTNWLDRYVKSGEE